MIRKALFDNSENENPGTDYKRHYKEKKMLLICIQRRKTRFLLGSNFMITWKNKEVLPVMPINVLTK